MAQCIDLRALYGGTYRIGCDPSCDRQHHGNQCDPWYAVIPCQHGHVYPHGGNQLGVATNTSGPVAKRLRALPGVRVTQDGSDGRNAVFDVTHFSTIAAIVRPKRRRRLSPEHKAKLAASNAKHRFCSASNRPPKAVPTAAEGKPDSQAILTARAPQPR